MPTVSVRYDCEFLSFEQDKGSKTKIVEIHNQRNPIFPEMKRPEPIPPNINVGLQATLDNHADVLRYLT